MAFTFFFRDQDCLDLAVKALLPQAAGRSRVRIWDAGCAMGQEPYTLAILLAENMGMFAFRNLEIHATDYDEPLLRVLQDGSYPYEELKRVPEAYFGKYFEAVPDHSDRFRVVERLRERMKIRHHNLLSFAPVRDNFSLIVCKNVLLHFQPAERVQVIRMFHQALEPGGLFVTERTQKLPPEAASYFEHVTSHVQLFRKIDTTSCG
jgi:chemotaxis protein methyltransferase CheR